MSLQYYPSARLNLALIRGEKFRIKVVGKPNPDRPALAGGGDGGVFEPRWWHTRPTLNNPLHKLTMPAKRYVLYR